VVAEMRADRKRTREVVGVTRIHVEMVGTPRGVPLVRSFGASGVLCGLGTLSRRSRRAVSLFRPRRRETSRAGARRRLRREELKERHGRAMNRSVSRMRGPKLFVRASTWVARVDEVRVECSRGYAKRNATAQKRTAVFEPVAGWRFFLRATFITLTLNISVRA
jgi:hypothetical protein